MAIRAIRVCNFSPRIRSAAEWPSSMMLEMMMDRVEIRIGRRLVIRAAGRFAIVLIVTGLLATMLIVSDRLDLI